MGYSVFRIDDVANRRGEDFLNRIVSAFSCVKNKEVDEFLFRNALDFSRRKMSITHLVFSDETGLFVGYFTLTHKPLTIPAAGLSTTSLKRIRRFSKPDSGGETYTLSAYLVAQIGKNATLSKRERIGGVQLLELAKNEIRAAQERVGGQMVFLEMEHGNAFLESFYHDNGFVTLGQRNSEEDKAIYDQMFIFLK